MSPVTLRKLGVKSGEVSEVTSGYTTVSELAQGPIEKGNSVKLINGTETTAITEIMTETPGRVVFGTQTSVYELIRYEENEIISTIKKEPGEYEGSNVLPIIDAVDGNWTEVKNIRGRKMMFSLTKGPYVVSLVESEGGKYVARFFRYSGSDREIKSLPGLRNTEEYMKGQENHVIEHHYVQEAKVAPEILRELYAIWNQRTVMPASSLWYQIPKEDTAEEEFGNEMERKTFEDPEWKIYQERMKWLFFMFTKSRSALIGGAFNLNPTNERGNNTIFGTIFEFLDGILKNETLLELYQQLKQELAKIPAEDKKNIKMSQPKYVELSKAWKAFFTALNGRLFLAVKAPESMMPDFDAEPTSRIRVGTVQKESFPVTSEKGEKVIFQMAFTSDGNVWIDNIYEAEGPLTTYGTQANFYNMGVLVYKPLDHTSQCETIPDEFKVDAREPEYTNINKLWQNIDIIQQYKARLIQRGLLSES